MIFDLSAIDGALSLFDTDKVAEEIEFAEADVDGEGKQPFGIGIAG